MFACMQILHPKHSNICSENFIEDIFFFSPWPQLLSKFEPFVCMGQFAWLMVITKRNKINPYVAHLP